MQCFQYTKQISCHKCYWSTLPFLICKLIQEVSETDIILSAQLKISVQVFCPTSLLNPYEKRYIPWKGNDNVYWKPDVARYHQSNCRAGTKKPKSFKEIETKCLHLNSVRTCIYRTHAKKKKKTFGQFDFSC